MIEVRHQRKMLARAQDAPKERHQFERVAVGDEAIRPIGEGLGAEANALQLREIRIEQRLHIRGEHAGRHDQGITASEQHVRYFWMLF